MGRPLQVAMYRLQVSKNSDSPLEGRIGFTARAKQHLTGFFHSKPAKKALLTDSKPPENASPKPGSNDLGGESVISSPTSEGHGMEISNEYLERGRRSGEAVELDSPERRGGYLTAAAESLPKEFVCPLSGALMADPVIVASGTTYERENIQAYLNLGNRHCFQTGETLVHPSSLWKNSALKTAIDNWCDSNHVARPVAPDAESARLTVEKACRAADSTASIPSSPSSRDFVSLPDTASFTSSDSSGESRSIRASGDRSRPEKIPEATSLYVWSAANLEGGFLSPTSAERQQNTERILEARHHTWSGEKPRKPMQILTNNSLRRDPPISATATACFDRDHHCSETESERSSASFFASSSSSPERSRTNSMQASSASTHHSISCASFPLTLTTTPSAFWGGGGSPSAADGPLDEAAVSSLVQKLHHKQTMEQEQGVMEIRRLTRISAGNRVALCELDFLAVLLPFLQSRYSNLQINAVAAVMNISLEKENKLRVARAGAIPLLVDVLKSGHQEAQEHAAGAIFSLALNDENKMAIGVLGAVPPLIHVLRTGAHGARRDSAMALYHLSFFQMNRTKLIKSGGVAIFLGIAQDEKSDVVSRALLILCNIAAMPEGRVALAELSAVQVMVSLLTRGYEKEEVSEEEVGGEESGTGVNWAEVREHAAAALLLLSHHNVRFKSQAMQAGALEGLQRLMDEGTPRAREKAAALLTILRDAPHADDTTEEAASLYRRSYVRSSRGGPDDRSDSAQF